MRIKAVCAVLLAGILWGVIGIFVKTLSAAGLSPLQITLTRLFFSALLFSSAVTVCSPQKWRVRARDLLLFVGTGIGSIVLFNTLYFYTAVEAQTSVAVVLLYTSPVFVMLLSALFFKERVTLRKTVALVLTFGGCIATAGLLGGGYTLPWMALLTGLGSGFFYSLYTIFGRVALRRYDSTTVTAYTFLFGFLGALPLGAPLSTARVFWEDPRLLLWGVGIAAVCTVLPFFLYTWGLARMDAGRAAILVAVEPLVGTLIGVLFYQEPLGAWKIAGVAAVLAAILLLNLPEKEKT